VSGRPGCEDRRARRAGVESEMEARVPQGFAGSFCRANFSTRLEVLARGTQRECVCASRFGCPDGWGAPDRFLVGLAGAQPALARWRRISHSFCLIL